MPGLMLFSGADQLATAAAALDGLASLYVGPDQFMPLASALAAVVGILLAAWNRLVALARRLWRLLARD